MTAQAPREVIREKVGTWLLEPRRFRRGERGYAAQALNRSPRALQYWAAGARASRKPRRGRPPHGPAVRRATYLAVRSVLREEGRSLSWREVLERLRPRRDAGEDLPRVLIQRYSCAIKRARRRARAASLAARQVHIEVLAQNVLWTGDATHIDRGPNGAETKAEVLSDVGTTRILDLTPGPPPTAKDVAAALTRAIEEHGAPLVFMSDNGPENIGEPVVSLLKAHQIVHLRNRPHTPQHNAHAERRQRDLKEALALSLGSMPSHCSHAEWQRHLEPVQALLNRRLRRQSRNWLTPESFHDSLPPWYPRLRREEFYEAACSAVDQAVIPLKNPNARRMAEREAIFTTLERFLLIRRSRGLARHTTHKHEAFSGP